MNTLPDSRRYRVRHRYFRVTAGPLFDAALRIEQNNPVAQRELLAFCNEVGAKNFLCWSDGKLVGVEFDHRPCLRTWKKSDVRRVEGAFVPRDTPQGHEMQRRIDALPKHLGRSEALRAVGIRPDIPLVEDGNTGYSAGIGGSAELGAVFVSVPWQDIPAADAENYRRARAAGSLYSMNLDHHLDWTPPDGWVEVTEAEVNREIDEMKIRAGREADLKAGRASL